MFLLRLCIKLISKFDRRTKERWRRDKTHDRDASDAHSAPQSDGNGPSSQNTARRSIAGGSLLQGGGSMLPPTRRIVSHSIEKIASVSTDPALAAFFITLPAIIYLLVAYLNLDLWYDELVTFDLFVFVPTEKVVTDYLIPNNHIFANLINHFYVHVFALEEFDLLENPRKVRILFFFYAMIAIIYVCLIGKRFFGNLAGTISVLILITTVPFLNFTLQIRRYSMSMSLVGMLIYHSFLYSQRGTWMNGMIVFLSAALAFYSIPSNIYIVFSIALFFFFFIPSRAHKDKEGAV